MPKISFIVLIFFVAFAGKISAQKTEIEQKLQSSIYKNMHVGFMLYDVETKKELVNFNGEKYFLPASNTKIFTLYSVLKNMNDSIPGILYYETANELHFQGTGDPTFLHPKFDNQRVLNFLKNSDKKLIFHARNFADTSVGLGWSWDDYAKNYSPERNAFPIAENLVSIERRGNTIQSFPRLFQQEIQIKENEFARESYTNKFYISSKISKTKVPYIVSVELTRDILQEIIGKPIELSPTLINPKAKILYSTKFEPVAQLMMEDSDNFLAEQLLITASVDLHKNIGGKQMIEQMMNRHLNDLSQKPIWNDGSGLSRYNLFSPKSIVQLLDKMLNEYSEERIFNLMAIGGKSGSLKNYYRASQPYVFAKTGGMSNTTTLSGYLKSKSGKTLIFSLMNNNTGLSGTTVRKENERFLNFVRDQY